MNSLSAPHRRLPCAMPPTYFWLIINQMAVNQSAKGDTAAIEDRSYGYSDSPGAMGTSPT